MIIFVIITGYSCNAALEGFNVVVVTTCAGGNNCCWCFVKWFGCGHFYDAVSAVGTAGQVARRFCQVVVVVYLLLVDWRW